MALIWAAHGAVPQGYAARHPERKPLHAGQIVQRICASDIPRPPAPFSIGDFQAVVGAGGIGVPADMDQLLRIKAAQVGQQVHLAGGGDLVF